MTLIVESHLESVRALCEKHQVEKLFVFGSAARDDFDPQTSDLDFLVVFKPSLCKGFDDVYFQLTRDLETLFGRSVDLVEYGAIRNPYFKQEVIETRVPLYAA